MKRINGSYTTGMVEIRTGQRREGERGAAKARNEEWQRQDKGSDSGRESGKSKVE
jgi:hypothetical protein